MFNNDTELGDTVYKMRSLWDRVQKLFLLEISLET